MKKINKYAQANFLIIFYQLKMKYQRLFLSHLLYFVLIIFEILWSRNLINQFDFYWDILIWVWLIVHGDYIYIEILYQRLYSYILIFKIIP
jgi:hypothetical protein